MPVTDSKPESQQVDPAKLLAYRVLTFSQRLYRGIEIVLQNELGLSVRQWRILLFLASYGSRSLQEIAAFWRYDKSQVSRAVSELVEKGLAVTERAEQDVRRVMVGLTAQGWRTYEQGLPLSLARQEKLTSCLTRSQLKEFERTLELLTRQADAMLDQAEEGRQAPAAGKGKRKAGPRMQAGH
ncbi:MarR family winged helix-turn-helix transcriptional regulator [Orrella sp. JC864]|uniref:MarR family winged helix-turn-helix transcriptional regulator n=1 Tax=Orrella sp. JC864 TaxID=3120298 RepID=UPI003009BBF6